MTRAPIALPDDIRRGLAALRRLRRPPGYAIIRWQEVVDGADRFAATWAAHALRLGWRRLELFGLHPTAPIVTHPRGLALLLAEAEVVALDADVAVIRSARGGISKYRRWRTNPPAVLAWEIHRNSADAQKGALHA